jgi:hypothetical protein
MNAFISYSITENEQYILSLLAQKVAETGLTLVTSYDQSHSADFQTATDIRNSALFIGLITRSGGLAKTSRVYSEFEQANLFSRSAILLVENTVSVAPWIRSHSNTVRFDRFFISQAIDEVKNKIRASQATQPDDNAAAWVLGGIAVLALLALLSSEKN